MAFLQAAANKGSLPTGPHEITNSCKFERANDESITTSNAAAGNKKTWTFSAWIKRTELGKDYHCIFGSGYTNIHFMDNDRLRAVFYDGSNSYYADTFAVFRDTSAWYHIVVSCDTTHGTRIQAVRMYINGVRVSTDGTGFSNSSFNNMPQNTDTGLGYAGSDGSERWIRLGNFFGGSEGFSGYMADVHYVNGTVRDADAFGEINDDGIWVPKKYLGDYGTQGFRYEFKDSSALGTDSGSEGHNANSYANIAAIDQATDTPTNNFCTINPLFDNNFAIFSLTEGGTRGPNTGENNGSVGTFAVDSGKWYWEGVSTSFSGTNYWKWGITRVDVAQGNSADPSTDANSAWYTGDNAFYTQTSTSASSVSYNTGFTGYTAGDIWSVSLNCDVSPYQMTFRINNSVPGTANNNTNRSVGTYASADSVMPFFMLANSSSDNTYHNFGNPFLAALSGGNTDGNGYGDFKYAPPSGYYALCTKNLAEYG